MDLKTKNTFQQLAVLAFAGMALAVAATTLSVLWMAHWHGPFRDMWEIYPFLVQIIEHSWSWQDLWEAYGYSHRLVIPKLLYIADHHFADASNHFLIAVSVLCQLGIVCLLFSTFKNKNVSKKERLLFLAAFVVLQFSGTLLFNLMHTFDVQWFVSCFFVVLGLYFLMRGDSGVSTGRQSISMACFLLACLSNFSAMAVWPLWAIYAWKKSARNVTFWFLIVLSIVLIALLSGESRIFFEVQGLVDVIKWIVYVLLLFPALYLSNPLSDPDYLFVGYFGALLFVLSFVPALIFSWRFVFGKHQCQSTNQVAVFFAALMLFAYGVSVLTALGRGYDASHVQAMRYQNIVLLYWSAALPFLYGWLKGGPDATTSRLFIGFRRVVSLVFPLALAGFLACQAQAWNDNLLLGRNVARSHLALMMGYSRDVPMIYATVSRSMIYVEGYHLEQERALYEMARKGIYAGPMAAIWLDGVAKEAVDGLPDCGSTVQWELKPVETPYAAFTGFTVQDHGSGHGSGPGSNRDQAALLSADGQVLALAIAEQPTRISGHLGQLFGAAGSADRGAPGGFWGISTVAEPPHDTGLLLFSSGSAVSKGSALEGACFARNAQNLNKKNP